MEMMSLEEQVQEQNAAIRGTFMALLALIEELHEGGHIQREAVAARLSRLRNEDGTLSKMTEASIASILRADFATRSTRDSLTVIDGDGPG